MSPRGAGDELWAAVGDPTRKQLLDALLTRGESTATALAADLPVTRQAVTKHLGVLDRVGLVQARRRGREVCWTVRSERLDEATEAMARLASQWERRLEEIKRLAETAQRETTAEEDAL